MGILYTILESFCSFLNRPRKIPTYLVAKPQDTVSNDVALFLSFSVYSLISRRKFSQMEVLENQNILVTISGKKNKIRVYYLSWLKSKIFKTEGVSGTSMHAGKFFTFVFS